MISRSRRARGNIEFEKTPESERGCDNGYRLFCQARNAFRIQLHELHYRAESRRVCDRSDGCRGHHLRSESCVLSPANVDHRDRLAQPFFQSVLHKQSFSIGPYIGDMRILMFRGKGGVGKTSLAQHPAGKW